MIDPGLLSSPFQADAATAVVWTITPEVFTLTAAAVAAVAFSVGWLSGYGWRGKHGSNRS
ncbi:MAG TPA: hypothetical protein PLQ49_10030 [Methanothrix sp.]|nr:hypothetical protein [Methanothrix sp.]